VIESLSPGANYIMRVDHPDYPSKLLKQFEISLGQTIDLGVILLERGGTIEGHVTDHEGKPISGAYVSVPDRVRPYQEIKTDKKGYYRITGVEGGERTVSCSLDYTSNRLNRSLRKKVQLEKGATLTVDFEYDSELSLSGSITFKDYPAIETEINVLQVENKKIKTNLGITRTDAKGNFMLIDISPGDYLLSIKKSSYDNSLGKRVMHFQHVQSVSIKNEDVHLNIDLTNPRVEGRIVDQQNNPVARQELHFIPHHIDVERDSLITFSWNLYRSLPLSKDGAFSMGHIPPGRYSVGIRTQNRRNGFQQLTEIDVREGKDIDNLVITVPDEENGK